MTITAIIIATCCYLTASIGCLKQRDYPHFLMWACYALANGSMIWYEYSKYNLKS